MTLDTTNTVGGGSSSQNNKKKKLLLKILLPTSLLIIALSIFLGCWFGCNRTTFILKNDKSVTDYLNKHKSVHKGVQHLNSTNWTPENRQWIQKNLNGQNLLNGIMSSYFDMPTWNNALPNSKWQIKHGRNWASLKSLDDSLDKASAIYWNNLLYRDRYVYEKITNTGIDVTIKWMTKNNINDPNEKPHMTTQEWNVPYLDDSFDITSTNITEIYDDRPQIPSLNSIIGYDYLHNQPSEHHIGVFGIYTPKDYPFLSKLDYPNVDVV